MHIGENIKRLREAAGHVNAAAFARSIGVTPGTLGDWEAGTYQLLRLDSLFKIASAIPCSIEELVTGVNTSYEESQAAARAASAQDEKGELNQGKTLAHDQENATKSPNPTPEQVGVRPQGEQLVQSTGTGAAGAAPSPRRPSGIDRAAIAVTLMRYADWLRDSEQAQSALRNAAVELARPEGGAHGAKRPGKSPGAGSNRRHHPRRGGQ